MHDMNNLTPSAAVSGRTGNTLALPAITDPLTRAVVATLTDRLRDSLSKLEVIVDWLENPDNNGSDQLHGAGLIASNITGELFGIEDAFREAFLCHDLKGLCRALGTSVEVIETNMERAALEAEGAHS